MLTVTFTTWPARSARTCAGIRLRPHRPPPRACLCLVEVQAEYLGYAAITAVGWIRHMRCEEKQRNQKKSCAQIRAPWQLRRIALLALQQDRCSSTEKAITALPSRSQCGVLSVADTTVAADLLCISRSSRRSDGPNTSHPCSCRSPCPRHSRCSDSRRWQDCHRVEG